MINSNQPIKNIIKSSNLIFIQIHLLFLVELQFALPFTFMSFNGTIKFVKKSMIQFSPSMVQLVALHLSFMHIDHSTTCSCQPSRLSSCIFFILQPFFFFFLFLVKEKDKFKGTKN